MTLYADHPVGFALKDQRVDLESLVCHREALDAGMTVESVYAYFQNHEPEYLGVTEDGRVIGMVSRGHIGFLLGSRFGFAVYGRQPVGQHLMAKALCVSVHTRLLDLLDQALSRDGEEFYDDVMLTDEQGRFKGIIQIQTLVRLQTRLIADTTSQIEVQRKTLAERNRALTESLDELRRSRGRYDILFQNGALGVALLNRHCEVESHNHRFSVLLGLDLSRDATKPISLCELILPAERQAFLLLVKRQETDGEENDRPSMAHSAEFRLQLTRLGIR
ncbi:MAG: hypothetical protein RL514_3846 [Verrucomicrobiota bacterium]|jgi:PAS domain-containing protein